LSQHHPSSKTNALSDALLALPHKTLSLQRNELLKSAGSIDTNIYFIETGSLRIFRCEGETEQNIRFGYQNNLLVSLDSFLSGKPSELWIQALKKSTVRVIGQQSFRAFLNNNNAAWIAILEDLVLQQMEREADLLTQSPQERYRRVRDRSPQLFQEIPHRHIANYLRMSPETLSRLKKS
jgi:CRP-like cAMP-binding protein